MGSSLLGSGVWMPLLFMKETMNFEIFKLGDVKAYTKVDSHVKITMQMLRFDF